MESGLKEFPLPDFLLIISIRDILGHTGDYIIRVRLTSIIISWILSVPFHREIHRQ